MTDHYLTAPDGEVGWHVVVDPHRCSRKHCPNPAVIYYLGRTYHRPRRYSRRWRCEAHMNEYTDARPWRIEGGRILREAYPHEVERDALR